MLFVLLFPVRFSPRSPRRLAAHRCTSPHHERSGSCTVPGILDAVRNVVPRVVDSRPSWRPVHHPCPPRPPRAAAGSNSPSSSARAQLPPPHPQHRRCPCPTPFTPRLQRLRLSVRRQVNRLTPRTHAMRNQQQGPRTATDPTGTLRSSLRTATRTTTTTTRTAFPRPNTANSKSSTSLP